MSSNLPPVYPLRGSNAKFDLKLSNPKGKLSDVWLQKEYQKLTLKSNDVRENRKRFRHGDDFGSEDTYDREGTESWEEMPDEDMDEVSRVSLPARSESSTQSSTSSSGKISNLSASRENGLVHPPKRRLTSNNVSEVNVASLMSTSNSYASLTPETISHFTQNVQRPITDHGRPRTPNAINSPTHTPISDFEDDQPQQLPLPSPSASPVQSEPSDVKVTSFDPIENQLVRVPTTQNELLEMMLSLSNYLNERNQNHFIFKLLQDVNRSSLSTFNSLIHHSLRRDLISNLPLEITYKILSVLDYKALLSISRVCKNWYRIINNTTIWINLLKRDKLITDDKIIQQELANPKLLIEEWSENARNLNVAQILYKKRCVIVNRWMDPNYIPKRISVTGHRSKVVTCLQHDDDKIVTGVDDKWINIYNTKTGKLERILEGHEGGVWALKYTGNTLVTGSTDRTVRVWNIRTGKCTHIFRGHTSTIRCLDIIHPTVIGKDVNGDDIIFPELPILVTGSRDHNIHVWKLPISNEDDDEGEDVDKRTFDSSESDNPYLIAVLSGHSQSVRSVSGHGNIIISGSYDSTVRVWDLMDNGSCRHILTGHHDRVYSTAMDFESKICYSGSMDSTIKIWNFETGKLLKTLEGHSSLVGLLDLVDGILVSAAADSTLRIWDPKTGKNLSKLEGHTGAITCFEHDGLRVISGSERMLKLWDAKKGVFARDLLADVTGGIWQVRIDYKRCVAAVQRFANNNEDETYIEILDFSEPPKR